MFNNIPYFYKERKLLLSQIFKDVGTVTVVGFVVGFVIEQFTSQQFKPEIIIWGTIVSLLFYWQAIEWRPKE